MALNTVPGKGPLDATAESSQTTVAQKLQDII